MADKVKLKGGTLTLNDDFVEAGGVAEDFTFVTSTLDEMSLYDFEGKVRIIFSLPSIDTGVCQTETRQFAEKLQQFEDVIGIVVSKDLPFALNRFCAAEGITNLIIGSDYRYGDFGSEFNAEIIDSKFKGLLARTVVVIDKKNKITYTELVPDITDEPNYDAALEAIKKLV